MPRIKSSTFSGLRDYVDKFGKDVFTTDGIILLCKICNIKVTVEKKMFYSTTYFKRKTYKCININEYK